MSKPVKQSSVYTQISGQPLAIDERFARSYAEDLQAALDGYGALGPADGMVPVVNGAAVIRIRGSLWNGDYGFSRWGGGFFGYQAIGEAFQQSLAHDDVTSVVLDIDSPGGVVNGLFDLVDEMTALREASAKPVWAFVNERALSAAYAIASTADRIIMPRTGEVGSIGVLTLHIDETKMLERFGVKITPVFAGKRKVETAWFRELSEEAEARLQADVDATYGLFAQTVARNRAIDPKAVLATEAGVFSGIDGEAVSLGLADEVMSARALPTALAEAVAAGSQTGGASARSTTPTKGKDSMSILFGKSRGQTADAMLQMLQEADANEPVKAVMARMAKAGLIEAQDPEEEDEELQDEENEEEAEGEGDEEEAEGEDNEEEAEGEEEDEEAEGDEDDKSARTAAGQKRRIAAILNASEAKGREALANHLAFSTDMSPTAAIRALKTAPKGARNGALADRMKQEGNPSIGNDAPAPTNPKSEEGLATSILHSLKVVNGR